MTTSTYVECCNLEYVFHTNFLSAQKIEFTNFNLTSSGHETNSTTSKNLNQEGSNSSKFVHPPEHGNDYAEASREHGGKSFTLFPAYLSWEHLWTFH